VAAGPRGCSRAIDDGRRLQSGVERDLQLTLSRSRNRRKACVPRGHLGDAKAEARTAAVPMSGALGTGAPASALPAIVSSTDVAASRLKRPRRRDCWSARRAAVWVRLPPGRRSRSQDRAPRISASTGSLAAHVLTGGAARARFPRGAGLAPRRSRCLSRSRSRGHAVRCLRSGLACPRRRAATATTGVPPGR
jgi:hypothetical protein